MCDWLASPLQDSHIFCTLSEHLKARPKDFHLQGGHVLTVIFTMYKNRLACRPLEKAPPKAQDGCGEAARPQFSSLKSQFCFSALYSVFMSPDRPSFL